MVNQVFQSHKHQKMGATILDQLKDIFLFYIFVMAISTSKYAAKK